MSTQLLLWPSQELTSRLEALGWSLTRDPIETHGYRAEWRLDGNGSPAWFASLAGLEDWLRHQERATQKRAAA
jgi:hypothetical protein